jgi:hypothetical protein
VKQLLLREIMIIDNLIWKWNPNFKLPKDDVECFSLEQEDMLSSGIFGISTGLCVQMI